MYQGLKYIHEIMRELWEHFIRHGLDVGFAGRIKYTYIDVTYMCPVQSIPLSSAFNLDVCGFMLLILIVLSTADHCIVRKHMDVHQFKRIFNITFKHFYCFSAFVLYVCLVFDCPFDIVKLFLQQFLMTNNV